jgi:hypothetical protein
MSRSSSRAWHDASFRISLVLLPFFVWTLVAHLLTAGCPSRVTWFIVSVVINAVEHEMWGWPITNIGKKIDKVMPAFAHLNSATPVVPVCMVAGIVTAVHHVGPYGIDWRSGVAMLSPIAIVFSTTTGASVASSQIRSRDNIRSPAVALAKPESPATAVATIAPDCNQQTEALICDIDGFGHRAGLHTVRDKWRVGATTPARCAL